MEYRDSHGPFANVDALTDVPGIGKANTAGPSGEDDGTADRKWWWIIGIALLLVAAFLFWWLTGGGADNPQEEQEAPTQVTATETPSPTS